MRPRHITYFVLSSLILLLIGVTLFNPPRQTPVAIAAAPATQHLLYLPLITKSAGTSTCGSGSLIKDGGFEASTSGTSNPNWQISTNIIRTIFDNSGIPSPAPTHSGTWKAWLGGDNLLQQSLTQTLTVPNSASNLQVTFWWQVNTSEPSPSGLDQVGVQIRNASGATQETVYHLYDVDRGSTWAQKTVSASQSYASQTIQLAITATTDSINPTSFFIDDVSVTCN